MRLRPPLWAFVLWLVIISTPGSQAARAEADSETWQATQRAMEEIMGNGAAADLAWEVSWADLGRPSAGNASAAPRPVKNELVQCLNKAYSAKGMTWDIAMHNTLASLRVLAMFRDEAAPQIPVTIVTTGSLDRLQQLRAQCKSWTGPSSMAVFIPVVQSTAWPLTEQNQEMMRDYVLQVAEFVAELKQHTEGCQPTVLLLYEVFVEDIAVMLFPVNMLRNYARLGARTPLVAMLDADLLPSRTLSDRLAQPEEASRFVEQVTKERAVYILPAFDLAKPYETALWADALATAPNKSLAVWGMQNWMLAPFHFQRWPRGHKLTDFQKWMVAEEDYTVRYQTYCEPWFIGSRLDLPWHDERYRGFGMNKIQHVHHVNHAGFQFRVMHDAFVVHRPHKHGAAEAVYKKRGKATNSKVSLRQYTERLFSNQYGMLKRGKDWSPALSDATSRCRADLTWFQAAAQAAQQPAGQLGQQGAEQPVRPLAAGAGLLVRAQALFTIT